MLVLNLLTLNSTYIYTSSPSYSAMLKLVILESWVNSCKHWMIESIGWAHTSARKVFNCSREKIKLAKKRVLKRYYVFQRERIFGLIESAAVSERTRRSARIHYYAGLNTRGSAACRLIFSVTSRLVRAVPIDSCNTRHLICRLLNGYICGVPA